MITTPNIGHMSALEIDAIEPLMEAFALANTSLPYRHDYWSSLRPWLLQKLDDDKACQLVARRGGRVAGYVLGLVQDTGPLLGPGAIGYVSLIVVRPEYRNSGIGSALWEGMLDWFRAKEIQTIELLTEFGNPVSNPYWERRGFEPLMVRRRLEI